MLKETSLGANSVYEDGTYLCNNPTWHEEDSQWKAKQIFTILNKNDITPSSICEVGCGAGGILNYLADSYGTASTFYGYEISPQAFDICRQKENKNLHLFHKDLLRENEGFFNVVMAIDVIEHVEDYFDFLRKFREKGKFHVFHIPLDLSVQTVLLSDPILKCRTAVGHIHYFTKETALATLKDTGYEVIDSCYTDSIADIPNVGWNINLMKLPRKLFFSISQDLAARVLSGFSLLVLTKSKGQSELTNNS
jgi:SAM-dependent methyltransferase